MFIPEYRRCVKELYEEPIEQRETVIFDDSISEVQFTKLDKKLNYNIITDIKMTIDGEVYRIYDYLHGDKDSISDCGTTTKYEFLVPSF